MRVDRIDQSAIVVVVAAHAALLWALSLPREPGSELPPGPAMEVSFVDETGLQSGAPTIEPAAQSVAPELGTPEDAAPPAAEAPVPEPSPRAIPEPTPPQTRPAQRQAQPTPAPPRTAPRRPSAPGAAGRAPANRGARIGPDILKGLGNDPAARSPRPSGAVMSAQARGDIASLITRQVQPCANRQRSPGPGAERIRVTIRLRLNRNGSLASAPAVIGREGVDDSNRRYLERVEENTIATFRDCSPLRGLPGELYDVPGGWRDFRLRYRLPG